MADEVVSAEVVLMDCMMIGGCEVVVGFTGVVEGVVVVEVHSAQTTGVVLIACTAIVVSDLADVVVLDDDDDVVVLDEVDSLPQGPHI